MLRVSIALCAFVLTATASAQSVDVERILLPLVPARVAGANGSEWVTDIALTNLSDTPLVVSGYQPAGGCSTMCTTPPPIPPRATIFVYSVARSMDVQGAFLTVEPHRVADLAITIRWRDVSRQRETWGTTIPAVVPDARFARRFGMTDIPMEPQFRSTLRIYDVGGEATAVRLRVYGVDPLRDYPRTTAEDVLLMERMVTLTIPTTGAGTLVSPAYAEVPLWREPELGRAVRIRVEIETLDARRAYWGFVSTTHNDTQHVTVIPAR